MKSLPFFLIPFSPRSRAPFFLWATLFVFLPTPRATNAISDVTQTGTYARMLDSLASDDANGKINRLQNFVRNHPAEERAYLKLLEQHPFSLKSSEAKAFFQDSSDNDKTRRNRHWMLAKLASCDTLPSAINEALSNFALALRDSLTPPSPLLLYDFIAFCHENSGRIDRKNLIRHHLFRSEDLTLALGFYSYLNEDYKQAELAFKQATARNSALVLYVLSDCFLRNERKPAEERFAQADSVSRHGLVLAQQNDDKEWQARFWASLGDIAYNKNDTTKARASYEQAKNLALAASDLFSRQKSLSGLGKLNHMQGNYAAAEALYLEAIPIAARICAHRDLSLIYSNYCQLLNELGRFAEALQMGELSRRYAIRAHDEEGQVRIQLKLARIYHDLRQSDFVRKMCIEARALALRRNYLRHYHRAGSLLADILAQKRKFEEARRLYDDYLNYLTANGDYFERHSYLAKKADTYIEEGAQFYDEAVALYQRAGEEAAKAGNGYYRAWYLLDIADLETKRGHLAQAQQALAEISSEALRTSAEELIRFKLSWGQFAQKSGEWEHAIATYREAAAIIDTTRPQLNLDHLRIGYFSDRMRAAQGLAECFYRRHRDRQAAADRDSLFYFMEMAKGRSFHDLNEEQEAADRETVGATAAEDYGKACTALQKLQRRIRMAPEKYEELRPALEAARYTVMYQRPQLDSSPQTRRQKNDAGIYTLAAAQDFLRHSQTALLNFHLSPNAAFMLVVTASETRALPLQLTQTELTAICDSLMSPFHADTLNAGTVESLQFRAGLAHRLYELLIKPAEVAVTLPKQLIVVPDGALINVPFEMFLTARPSQAVYTPKDSAAYAKDFLLHRYAFVYSPTFGLLKKNLRTPSPTRGVFVLANPLTQTIALPEHASARTRIWTPLPFTELEAERIEKMNAHVTKRTRAEATQTAFFEEATQQRALHFATHAFVDSAFDAFSGLVLAMSADSTDDGLLMGYEIADHKLSNDLVSLSACETGLGNLVEGEGTLGLPRLFLRAGAKSVLMTLWQVDDRFAAELVPQLYDGYLNRGLAKVEALTDAKRAILLKNEMSNGVYYQHPFYWAAFTLYGDPGQKATSFFTPNRIFILGAFILMLLTLFIFIRLRAQCHLT